MPGNITLACLHCGVAYQRFPSQAINSKFCTAKCQHEYKRTGTRTLCKICGEEFYKILSNDTVYCSRKCESQDRPHKKLQTLVCKACGKSYTRYASLKSSYCSRACFFSTPRTVTKKPVRKPAVHHTKTCKQCGKVFKCRPSHKQPYCSMSCFRATHVRKTASCKICGKEFAIPKSKDKQFCSVRCSNQRLRKGGKVPLVCKRCEKEFWVYPSASKTRQYCSRACAHDMRGPTSIEIAVENALKALKIPYQPQCPISHFTIDFFLPDRNIAIEADGKYWHANSAKKDAARDKYLAKLGITTIRIGEREILAANNVSKLVRDKLKGIHTLPL